MNNTNNHKDYSFAWLNEIKAITTKNSTGNYKTYDATQTSLVINWYITDILSSTLKDFKKECSTLGSQVTAKTETNFLKYHPEAVSSSGFFKTCEPLFAHGIDTVNWNLVQSTLEKSIQQFYLMDISLFGTEIINTLKDDLYFFASIKNEISNELLGFFIASITPALSYGTIKLVNLIVAPSQNGQELEKILLSSIFKVFPQVKRIFTLIRPTDHTLLSVYTACSFSETKSLLNDPQHINDMRYFIALEYDADKRGLLQKIAQ